MPLKTKTAITGLSDLVKSLDQLTEKNFRMQALKKAGKESMAPILADAIRLAPLLSDENIPKNKKLTAGTLKGDIKYSSSYNASIKVSKRGKVKPLSMYEWVGRIKTGKATQDYAIPVEYGRDEYIVVRIHVFGYKVDPYEARMIAIKPNPFMRKALDENSRSAPQNFKRILLQAVQYKAKQQERRIKKRQRQAAKYGTKTIIT